MRVNLKNMRIAKNYTQLALAKEIGVSTRYIKALESGTANGSITVWERLRDVLGAKSVDILRQQDSQ